MCPNYNFQCTECDLVTTEFYKYEARPEEVECAVCGTRTAKYKIAMPGITRASYVDGTNRFQDAKEAAKLNKEMASSRSSTTKQEMAKEIKKLGYKFDK
jgi:hypothetical protein